MVIGLAGHPMKLQEIEEVLMQVDSGLEIRKLEFSEIASIEHILPYQTLQESVDIVILGGYYDYLFFCNHVVFEKVTGIHTVKPANPFLVTPTGIAMNCKI